MSGEFRYVFYTPPGRYAETLRFYTEQLGFPIVGGFSHGTYVGCGNGMVEIIDGDVPDPTAAVMLQGAESYQPPRGGWLLIEVDDVDSLHRRLVAVDVPIVHPPVDLPWRFRHLTVRDPSDNIVSFFVRLPGWEEHHGHEPANH